MPLTGSPPITLSDIQSEFSAASLSAASTSAGLDPLPTSMLDFLGLSACSVSVSSQSITNTGAFGFSQASATAEITVSSDGTLYWSDVKNEDGTQGGGTGNYGSWKTGSCPASDYYIRATTVTQSGSGDVFIHTRPATGWVQVTADQTFQAYCLTNSNPGADSASCYGQYSVEFKRGVAGATLATVTFSLDAGAQVFGE